VVDPASAYSDSRCRLRELIGAVQADWDDLADVRAEQLRAERSRGELVLAGGIGQASHDRSRAVHVDLRSRCKGFQRTSVRGAGTTTSPPTCTTTARRLGPNAQITLPRRLVPASSGRPETRRSASLFAVGVVPAVAAHRSTTDAAYPPSGECQPDRSGPGDEGDDYVGGVSVEILATPVVDEGGARVGVSGGDLYVAEGDTDVERGQ
jgi:hypothetical protein